jgi:hypothetical protein
MLLQRGAFWFFVQSKAYKKPQVIKHLYDVTKQNAAKRIWGQSKLISGCENIVLGANERFINVEVAHV